MPYYLFNEITCPDYKNVAVVRIGYPIQVKQSRDIGCNVINNFETVIRKLKKIKTDLIIVIKNLCYMWGLQILEKIG